MLLAAIYVQIEQQSVKSVIHYSIGVGRHRGGCEILYIPPIIIHYHSYVAQHIAIQLKVHILCVQSVTQRSIIHQHRHTRVAYTYQQRRLGALQLGYSQLARQQVAAKSSRGDSAQRFHYRLAPLQLEIRRQIRYHIPQIVFAHLCEVVSHLWDVHKIHAYHVQLIIDITQIGLYFGIQRLVILALHIYYLKSAESKFKRIASQQFHPSP